MLINKYINIPGFDINTGPLSRHLFWNCWASSGYKFPYFTGPVGQHSFRSFIVSIACTCQPPLQLNTIFISSLILCCHFVYLPSCFDTYEPHKKSLRDVAASDNVRTFCELRMPIFLGLRRVTSIILVYRSIFFCTIHIGYCDMPSTYRFHIN